MVKGGADNRSFRNTRRNRKKGKPFQGTDQSVSVNVEEHDDIIDDEEINVSSITDTSADVTLDPAVDSDGRPNTDVEDEGVETVSQNKVKEIDFPAEENEHLSGYRIMDMDILLACPKCFVVGSLTLVQNAKYGLAFKFSVCCNNCKDWKTEFITSTKKSKKVDINYKSVYAMYETLWKGLSRSSKISCPY